MLISTPLVTFALMATMAGTCHAGCRAANPSCDVNLLGPVEGFDLQQLQGEVISSSSPSWSLLSSPSSPCCAGSRRGGIVHRFVFFCFVLFCFVFFKH